jgi:prophage regulatory protein
MQQNDCRSHPKYNETRLIRIGQVMRLTGLSRSYIYALSSDGRFPKSISLVPGGTSRAWVESQIQGWINQRIKAGSQEVNHA